MKKILLPLFLIVSFPCFADIVGIRNDNGETTTAGTNGGASMLSTDLKGRLMVSPLGTPISSAVATTALTVAHGSVAFGSVGAAYSTALTNVASLKSCKFYNQTDAGVIVSYDGTNDAVEIPAGGVDIYDWASNGRHLASNISVKRLAGAPTTGSFFLDCYS